MIRFIALVAQSLSLQFVSQLTREIFDSLDSIIFSKFIFSEDSIWSKIVESRSSWFDFEIREDSLNFVLFFIERTISFIELSKSIACYDKAHRYI